MTAKIQPNSCRLLHPPQSLKEWKLAAIRWELLTALRGKIFPLAWLIKTVGAVGLNGTTLFSELRPSTSRNSHKGETRKFTTWNKKKNANLVWVMEPHQLGGSSQSVSGTCVSPYFASSSSIKSLQSGCQTSTSKPSLMESFQHRPRSWGKKNNRLKSTGHEHIFPYPWLILNFAICNLQEKIDCHPRYTESIEFMSTKFEK